MEEEQAEEEMEEHSQGGEGSEGEDEENNSCTTVYFQSQNHDFETGCCLGLIESILYEKMFD